MICWRASDGVAGDGQPSIDITAFGQIVLVVLLYVLSAVAYAVGVLNALIRRNTRALGVWTGRTLVR